MAGVLVPGTDRWVPRRSDLVVSSPNQRSTRFSSAEHWIHLPTTNPIESTFATVRHRTKVTKGPGTGGRPRQARSQRVRPRRSFDLSDLAVAFDCAEFEKRLCLL
jgi:hypothetical protein